MSKLVMRVTSGLQHSRLIESFAKFIDRNEYEQHFVFLNEEPPPILSKLKEWGFQTSWFRFNKRTDLIRTIWQLKKFFTQTNPDIVHAHLVDACLAGLTAAKLAGIKNRIHTRHHGTECHEYYPHGVYYDKYVNRLSKKIMATSNVVKEILVDWENVPSEKVSVINHGFDFAEFATNTGRIATLREKYQLSNHSPIIGVISRFDQWKGIQYIIPAFAELKKEYKNAKLVLANARGPYEDEIENLLKNNLSEDDYIKIPFEVHIFDLYKLFDVFVHVPVGKHFEALGQTYIEALYTGIPSVFTMAGVANDFIEDERNALTVPFKNTPAIVTAVKRFLTNEELKKRVVENGKADVTKRFSGERLRQQFSRLYEEVSGNN